METLMDSLIASALQNNSTSDQTTPEDQSTETHLYPRNGWRAEDIKKCLGYTDDQYTHLYSKVEEAMRHANLIEVSLTGNRKTMLFAILDALLPHNDAPTVPDFLRIKALHQLAIRINHNVKTRSGHAHHRKRPPKLDRVPIPPELRRKGGRPPGPAKSSNQPPRPAPPHTPAVNPPIPATLQTVQPETPTTSASHYCGIGSMLLLAERDDGVQSTCSLKHITRGLRSGAPMTVDNVSFDAWKAILEKDGVLRGAEDDVSIMWRWAEKHVKVTGDRVLRTVVEFMSTHGGFIEFSIKSTDLGKKPYTVEAELMSLHNA
ncbi:MAG: hypothetical protein Q9170_002764 [Blastenia crenularia]